MKVGRWILSRLLGNLTVKSILDRILKQTHLASVLEVNFQYDHYIHGVPAI